MPGRFIVSGLLNCTDAACLTSCHLGFVSDSCHFFHMPNWVSQSFRHVCRMSAVSQYCDCFFWDALLRRNDLADPMPWVSVCDVSQGLELKVYFETAFSSARAWSIWS